MNPGILFSKTVSTRNSIVKDMMCKSNIQDDERNVLVFNLKVENYCNLFARASLVPILLIMYKKKVFDKPTKYFLNEILIAASCLFYLSVFDYGANEYMWQNSQNILEKYGVYSQGKFIDKESYENMKMTYKRQKQLMEERKLEKPTDDKLYD